MRFIIISAFVLVLISATAGYSIGVQGDLLRIHELTPGETFKGEIVVSNSSKAIPKVAKAYQTDARDFPGGSDYGQPAGKFPRSNASWIKFSPEILNIPAGGKAIINYEGRLPDNAEGSYWSVFMVEKLDEGSIEVSNKKPAAGQLEIKVTTRYAVRILTNVKNTGSKKVKFLKRELNDKKIFFLDIENTGTRFFPVELWVELFDAQGKAVGKYNADRIQRTYPGSSFRFQFDFSQVAPGKYTALCAVDAGDDDIFGARYQIEVK